MRPRIERLEEGLVRFLRIYFRNGFIDRWTGDSINDPNNQEKSNLQLNSYTSYYRLNKTGKWIHIGAFDRKIESITSDTHDDFTAKEVWEYYMRHTEE